MPFLHLKHRTSINIKATVHTNSILKYFRLIDLKLARCLEVNGKARRKRRLLQGERVDLGVKTDTWIKQTDFIIL